MADLFLKKATIETLLMDIDALHVEKPITQKSHIFQSISSARNAAQRWTVIQMRIVDKVQFTLGIFDIVVGIGLTVAVIIMHRYTKIFFTVFPVGMGIMALFRGIETRKQRQEKEERIKAQARLLGVKFDD